MKFTCGKTSLAKYLETKEEVEKKIEKYSKWRRWFAWYPVTISEKDGKKQCVWLQMLERRWTRRWIDKLSSYPQYIEVFDPDFEYREVK